MPISYKDNIYETHGSIGGFGDQWAHAVLGLQALKVRDAQNAQQNALQQAYYQLAQQKQGPELGLLQAQTNAQDASTGYHNQLAGNVQEDRTAGQNVQNLGAIASALRTQGLQNNPEMITRGVQAARQAGGFPMGQVDIPTYNSQPSMPSYAQTEDPSPFSGMLPQQAPQQDLGALANLIIELAPHLQQSIYQGRAATQPSSAQRMTDPTTLGPGHEMRGPLGDLIAQGPPMIDHDAAIFQRQMDLQKARAQTTKEMTTQRGRQAAVASVMSAMSRNAIMPKQGQAMLQQIDQMYPQGEQSSEQQQGILQPRQQTMQGVTPPYQYDPITVKALRAIANGAKTEDVKKVYKQQTGKELVLPADMDTPNVRPG